jgi:hypothetical protein
MRCSFACHLPRHCDAPDPSTKPLTQAGAGAPTSAARKASLLCEDTLPVAFSYSCVFERSSSGMRVHVLLSPVHEDAACM